MHPVKTAAQTFGQAVEKMHTRSHGETCEQRRARAYGIDLRPGEPDPLNYLDPVAYALAHAQWEKKQRPDGPTTGEQC